MADKTEFDAERDHISAQSVGVAANSNTFVVVPQGYNIEGLEQFQPAPNRVVTDYKFRDTKSLATYLNRFQGAETTLFSAPTRQMISAVLDHHGATDAPSHCDHKAAFHAQFTSQYQAWRSVHGKSMSQISAGLFLEERAIDVVDPDAATIMDLVMTFDAIKKVNFRQSQRLHDGQRQFSYVEENEVRGAVTLPERILIKVPVFDGQEPDTIRIRIKYRIEDGSLSFTFEIHERDDVERVAFERCEDSLLSDMKVPLDLLRVV